MTDGDEHPLQEKGKDAMAKKQTTTTKSPAAPVRDTVRSPAAQGAQTYSVVRATATTAFQASQSVDLTPSFNVGVSFDDWNIVPKGKRAVIELVTAQIIVPEGEWARLRMYTSLGSVPSNLDLFLTFQGNVGGKAMPVVFSSKDKHGSYAIQSTCGFASCFDSWSCRSRCPRSPAACA